jgi:putative transposase
VHTDACITSSGYPDTDTTLTDGVGEYLKIKMEEVRKYYPEIEYLERNIQSDHIHIVISFPPKYSIAKVVQIIKQNTGRALCEKFEFIRKRYWRRGGCGRLDIS